MAISIKVAKTAEDVDAVLRLRHQVYVDDRRFFEPRPDGVFFDRFDCYPSTRSILARESALPGATPIGTVRFACATSVGLPCDSFFDSSSVVAGLEGGVGTVGMLAVAKNFRHSIGLVSGLFKFAAREILRAGGRHIVAPVSPDAEPLLRALGGRQIGDVLHHESVDMTPLHIDLEALNPFFREHVIDPKNPIFDDLEERRLYARGEAIIREGECGDEAFVIMRGSVRVIDGQPESGQVISLLGPGQIVGDMALLDGGARSASVVVHSRVLDVAVIPKDAFQHRLASDGAFCRQMVQILGARARKAMLHLPQDSLLEYDQTTLTANVLIEGSVGGTKSVDRGWLAAECGLRLGELASTLERWEQAGIISRSETLIDVADLEKLMEAANQVAAFLKTRNAEPPSAAPLRSVA